jgi:Na+-driven multidrug efflux pump
VLILPRYWQLNGVWLSFPGADVLTFLLTLALLIPLIRRFQKAITIEKRGKTIPVIADSLSDSMKK